MFYTKDELIELAPVGGPSRRVAMGFDKSLLVIDFNDTGEPVGYVEFTDCYANRVRTELLQYERPPWDLSRVAGYHAV